MVKSSSKPSSRLSSEAIQKRILKAVLAEVPCEGWTESAYEAGLKAARVSRADADALMPGGIRDVIRLFGEETDAAMGAHIKVERGFAHMRVREKVAFAVRARFESLLSHREAVKRLMVWYAMPSHAAEALRRLYRTVDLIWVAAGDTSNDYNFYTKRLLLAAVIKATMLFWLGDETPGCSATWAFLDRRINEVVRAGKAISLAKEWKPSEIVEVVRRRIKRA